MTYAQSVKNRFLTHTEAESSNLLTTEIITERYFHEVKAHLIQANIDKKKMLKEKSLVLEASNRLDDTLEELMKKMTEA